MTSANALGLGDTCTCAASAGMHAVGFPVQSAFMRGFDVFFAVDGTATYNESFHRASVLNLSHGFPTAVLYEDIQERLVD